MAHGTASSDSLGTPTLPCTISELTADLQTRSGKLFGSWDGPRVLTSNPAFDFTQLLQDAVKQENSGDHDDESSASEGGEANSESDDDIKTPTDPAAAELAPPQPPTASTPILSAQDRRRIRKKSQSHFCRNNKRQKTRDEAFSHHEHSMRVQRKYITTCDPIVTPMSLNSRAARLAYIGLRDGKSTQTERRLEDLVGPQSQMGFWLVEWNGRSNSSPGF